MRPALYRRHAFFSTSNKPMSPNNRSTVEITTAEDFAKAMESENVEKQKDWRARRDIAHAKITDHERRVIERLAVAWNEYNALQLRENEDKAEFRQCINRAAAIIAVRVARRVNPECWTPDAESESQREAAGTADEKPDGQAENAEVKCGNAEPPI